MALAADYERPAKNPSGIRTMGVTASSVIFKGSLVMIVAATGYASVAASGTSAVCAGVACHAATGTLVSGVTKVDVWTEGIFQFTGSTSLITWVGQDCWAADDTTVDITTTTGVLVGVGWEYISASVIWVKLNPHAFI